MSSITQDLEIHSDNRIAKISVLGAELRSLKSTVTNEEYMWSGNPDVWSGIAPILFPIVGGLKGDQYRVDDSIYTLEKHGFARRCDFTVVEHENSRISLQLTDNSSLLKMYPWRFRLLITFQFIDDSLTVAYAITNNNPAPMPFNIGSHPAFCLPTTNGEIEDYEIVFDSPENLDCYSVVDNLLALETQPCLQHESAIALSKSIFDHDALVFKHIASSEISIVHRTQGQRVRVHTGGAPHLGLWAKPKAPYVCIEPWWGHADFSDTSGNIFEKESIQILASGETFNTAIAISTFD